HLAQREQSLLRDRAFAPGLGVRWVVALADVMGLDVKNEKRLALPLHECRRIEHLCLADIEKLAKDVVQGQESGSHSARGLQEMTASQSQLRSGPLRVQVCEVLDICLCGRLRRGRKLLVRDDAGWDGRAGCEACPHPGPDRESTTV